MEPSVSPYRSVRAGPAARQPTDLGEGIRPGARHYRTFIGAPQTYDIFAHMQFSLLTLLGMRQEHTLLDIGCGSLRVGKLFLMYLLEDRYFGIEPEQWLVEEGIEREIGDELIDRKRPRFLFHRNFPCSAFGVRFDFILAHSIFSHASVAQIRQCFAEVRRSMKDSSIFASTFLEGDADYAGDEWAYPESIRYRALTIERLAAEAGLGCRRLDWFHIGGQAWYVFFVPGREPQIDQLASLNQVFPIQQELTHYRQRNYRLERIEAHPLFRLASALKLRLRRR